MALKIDTDWVICFDLDDTLYNEKDYLRSAFKEIASSIDNDWKHIYSKMMALFENKKDVFQWVELTYDLSKRELLNTYREHTPKIRPFDGVVEAFNCIKKKGASIAIITDGRSSTQRRKINALGLGPIIDQIVISEEIGSEKPSLKNFQMIEQYFGKSKYVYIGDNYTKDFIGPNELGWITIALKDNGENIHKTGSRIIDDKRFLPNYEVESIKELIQHYLK